MHLRELRIHGFKSFADPTQLSLEPGVTAIVGPNGCGKSNIADAIRWVLGEQSSKSLRAGAMQDVIFQGTTSRKPLNLSEVSLVFTDCEAQLGTAFKEVEVTRRVTRDGGSDYFINGKACRLKDIQRLFLDTGVGQVSYSFMLQGQIDQVLSSNPSERRAIFEEAAGISRYKAQRREALAKLKDVETNLARVTDVMEEVGRRIGSLRRQAAKAIRYKRIKHRLSHLELALSARRYSQLKEKETETVASAEGLRTLVLRSRGAVEERERRVAERKTLRTELNERLQQARQNVFDLRSQRDQAVSKAEVASVRAKDFGERQSSLEKEIVDLTREHGELSGKAEGERKAREAQMEMFGDTGKAFEEKQRALAEANQRLEEAERELSRSRQSLLMKESGVTRLRSNCTTLELDLKGYQARHAGLNEEIQAASTELETLRAEQKSYEDARQESVSRKAAQEQELTILRESVEQAIAKFREDQSRVQNTDRDLATLIARAGLLEELQRKLEGFSEGAKAILKGKLGDTAPADRCRLVMAQLSVDEKWAAAVELLLGAAVDAIALTDIADAPQIFEALEQRKLGRVCLVAPTREGAELPSDPPIQGLKSARHLVSARETGMASLVERLFTGCYFCESLEQFLGEWGDKPEWPFNLVATLDGALIDGRGLIYSGGTKAKQDSFLKRESQIRDLKKQQRQLEAQLEKDRVAATESQAAVREAEKAVETQRKQLVETGEALSAIQAQARASEEQIKQATRRLELRQRELQQLDKSRQDSEARLVKARAELKEMDDAIEQLREQISAAEQHVVNARKEREAHREAYETMRLNVAEKKQRLEMLQRGLEETSRRVAELAAQRLRREKEIQTVREQQQVLTREALEQKQLADKLGEELNKAHAVSESRRDALLAVEREIQSLEEGLGADRQQLDKRIAELNEREVALAKQRSELEFLTEEARREHDVDIRSVDWRREIWNAGEELPARMNVDLDEQDDPLDSVIPEIPPARPVNLENVAKAADWSAIQEEVNDLRGRISAMGPVNLVAIEEYRELKDRHEFLKSQSDDLWQAKEQLVSAIDDINQTSAELFRETFEQIRENFKYTFETLFGGGESDLVLVDSDDVLESGIEISARPPGTRLRSLALLSGGQKTMTAVALLFAIYMVKPSPFCVLDEIDAPLDDANIGRFCKMLERFLEYSQFLIITHNKRTISSADTIYGVTMQERGVSRVISMRFDRKADKLQLAPEQAAQEA